MKPSIAIGSLFAFCLLAASSAHADSVTIDYDFRSGSLLPTTHTSLTFSATNVAPGILTPAQAPQITATGQAFSESPFTVVNSFVGRSVAGLGVSWTGTVFGSIPISDTDANELDGFGPDEALHLTFSNFGLVDGAQLTMAGFLLTNEPFTGGNEQAKLYKNNVLIGTITLPNTTTTPAFVNLGSFGITLDEGDVFTIRVNGSNDDFALMGVQITANTNTVPEPGLFALLVAGLVGVGVRRARRRPAR